MHYNYGDNPHKAANSVKPVGSLQNQFNLLDNFIDCCYEMVCYCNSELIIEYANKAYHNLFGKNGQSLVGQSVKTVLGEKVFNKAQLYIDKVLSGEQVLYFEQLVHNGNQFKFIEVRLIPEKETEKGNTIGYWATLNDLTNEKKSDGNFLTHSLFYKRFREELWMADLKFQFTYISPYSKNIFGFAVEERLTQSYREILIPDSFSYFLEVFQTEIAKCVSGQQGKKPVIMGLEAYHKNGEKIWVEIEADFLFDSLNNLVGIYGITRDITERKIAQLKATKSQNIYKAIFESTGTATLIVEEDTTISMANRECFDLTGYSAEELVGRKWVDFVQEESLGKMLLYHNRRRLSTDSSLKKYEVKLINKKRETREAIISVGMLPDTTQSIVSIFDITEQKQTLQLKQELEHRFQNLYENASVGLYRTTTDGQILMANPTLIKLLGFSSLEELQKSNLEKEGFVSQGKREVFKQAFKNSNLIIGFESEWKSKNGEVIYVRENVHSIKDINGQVLFFDGSVENITESKKVEQERENERILLRTIIDNIPHAIYLKDLELRKLIANDTDVKNMGLSHEEEAIGKTDFEIFPHAQAELFNKVDQLVINTGKPVLSHEEKVILKNGVEKWMSTSKLPLIDVSGNIRGLVGVGFDITEIVKAREKINLQEKALNSAANAIIITNKNGIIEWVNEGFTKLTGYSVTDSIGKTPGELVKSGKHSSEFYNELWSVILAGKVWFGEFINKRKNGELYDEEETISPILNELGEITHFVGIKNEITQRKILENELIFSKEKAEESERLKSAFLANMSHEIRTPLNGILGFLELADDEDLTEEDRKMYFEVISKSSNRLTNTIDDIIFVSSIDSNALESMEEKFDINALLDDFLSSVSLVNKNPLTEFICNKSQINNISIQIDKNIFRQILQKLLDNAFKFTEKGYVELGVQLNENDLVFSVSDTGIGVAKKNQQVIFDKFRQEDFGFSRSYEGSGLGLYIVKKLVERFQGKIWLESEQGKGSVIYFTFPVIREKEEIPAELQANERISKPFLAGKTILITEDEISNFIYLEAVFNKYNSNVIHAKNGKEAIDVIRSGMQVDLILMDLKMPIMDGFVATKEIRKLNSALPIIAQTAFALSKEKENAMDAGCNDYLTKPIRMNELINCISQYIK